MGTNPSQQYTHKFCPNAFTRTCAMQEKKKRKKKRKKGKEREEEREKEKEILRDWESSEGGREREKEGGNKWRSLCPSPFQGNHFSSLLFSYDLLPLWVWESIIEESTKYVENMAHVHCFKTKM